jgi:hypothetical protein
MAPTEIQLALKQLPLMELLLDFMGMKMKG